ncbi:hypothetical protein C3B60_06055 [Cryobacterium zongtaii]|nr:hypothetical protein C3B60_06055 [Cryobacterium zongtaii]
MLQLQANFPHVVRSIERIDISLLPSVKAWIELEGAAAVAQWVGRDTTPAVLASLWTMGRQLIAANLLSALIKEQRLCTQGDGMGAYLRSSSGSYANNLLAARRAVAAALVQNVYVVPFHKPVVLTRAANLARGYLQELICIAPGTDGLSWSNENRHAAERDFGKVVVVAARFSTVEVGHLETALGYLRASAERSSDITAASYHLEASLEMYRSSNDKNVLTDIAGWIATQHVPDNDWGTWHLNVAEVWLNLIEHAQTERGRLSFLAKARASLAKLNEIDLDLAFEVRFRMLAAIAEFLANRSTLLSDLTLRGMKLPFALRVTNTDMPPILFQAADALVGALAPAANRGQYAYRDSLADLLSRLARHDKTGTERANRLREAIRLRNPVAQKDALAGMRSRLAQAQDYLFLARLESASDLRRRGVDILIEQHMADDGAPSPLVLLATEIEEHGALSSVRAVASMNVELLSAVRSGDSVAILRMAAKCALASPELRRRGLGGRGGVVTVDDYSGVSGQTFILKDMSLESQQRDLSRAQALSVDIRGAQLEAWFGVVEHLMSEHIDGHESGVEHVISVRRYLSGKTLRAALEERTQSPSRLLKSCVEFLAFIHANEAKRVQPRHVRREIKTKELGRWLKTVTPRSEESFEKWWALVESMPALPRRDAHSLNWLVDSESRILAVDLETVGSRPAMYEVAQLIDDWPIYAADDWAVRNELHSCYVRALKKFGVDIDFEFSLKAYQASTAARAVSLLTDPTGTNSLRLHGFRLLKELASESDFPDVAAWAQDIAAAWSIKAGLSDPTRFSSISPADKTRISKAMAFHLRHDADAFVSRGGWMFAEDLAEKLQASGHRVTPEQLLVVAGAMGETRFELDGLEIRALYGHSVDMRIEYAEARAPKVLYHATTNDNLASIFEARAGLRPMSRVYVHLSDTPEAAIQVGARRGAPVQLLGVDPIGASGLVFAGASTWLAKAVKSTSLSVMTVVERVALELED